MQRVTFMVLLSAVVVVVGFAVASHQAPRAVMVLASDWRNECSDARVPGSGTISPSTTGTGSARWNYPVYCSTCTEYQDSAAPHYADIMLDTTGISCPGLATTYVSSIYVSFCNAMSGSFGQKVGIVTWYAGSTFIATTDLTLFGGASPYSLAYAVIPCASSKPQPDNLHVYWGGNYGGVNPALGNGMRGFDILIQCCNT